MHSQLIFCIFLPGLSCQSRHLCQLCSPGDSRLYTCRWSSSHTGGLILEPRPRGCPAGTRCAPGSAPCSASCVSTDVTETSQRPHSNSQLPGAALQEQHLKNRSESKKPTYIEAYLCSTFILLSTFI